MLAHLDLTVLLALNAVVLSKTEVATQKIPLAPNEASLIESKDVLLQMLEKKLKEIKDSKKLKNGNGDVLPKNVDINLKSNGISAVGEAELLLRYGKNGQGTINLNSEGISNVGKAQLLMGTGDNGLRLPGLGNLFSGSFRSGDQNDENRLQPVSQNDISFGFRRQTNVTGDKATSEIAKAETVETEKGDKAKPDEKAIVETTSNVGTDKTEGPTGKVAMQTVSGSNIATGVASSSPVANSDPPIKSDIFSGNVVASNGESVNKV